MRFLALGHMVGRDAESELVDVMSAVFRLVDHTDFDRYAAHMLKGMGCTDFDRLYDLISL